MKNMNSNSSNSSDNGNNSNNIGVRPRHIPARKIAERKRAMDGAEKRVIRLESELADARAIIARKYTERKDENGKVVGHTLLTPAQIKGIRLKRNQIDKDLAIAKGDYFQAKQAYEAGAGQNIEAVRNSANEVKKENKTRREAKALLKKQK